MMRSSSLPRAKVTRARHSVRRRSTAAEYGFLEEFQGAVLSPHTPSKLMKVLDLHRTCSDRLDRLESESRKTLNLLALLTHVPLSAEIRAELELQREREDAARSDFQANRRELISLMLS